MGSKVSVSKRADTRDIRFLARTDTLAFPDMNQTEDFYYERERFWRGLLTPPGDRVPWSKEEGNSNIRIARATGAVRVSGYLALGLPVEAGLGLVRPGLSIVVVEHFPEAQEVRSKLHELGEKLLPSIVEVAEIHPAEPQPTSAGLSHADTSAAFA